MPDTIVLRIVAAQRSDNRKIFDKRITLPIDDETRSLLETHGPESGVSTATAAVSWVRPGYRVQDGANAPRMETAKGYTAPQCIHCPHAQYTDAALAVKMQGTVTMDVLFDAEGLPAEIAITDGLPCGLNQRAVDTVAEWKVKPAEDADGTPTAVWVGVDVNFQIF